MPVIIKFNFPAGRYHATPWGRHVNEGVVEWPPSPWRLLRGLVAVWKRTCPELTDAQVKRVLTPLTQPPRFSLPPHKVAHTRHYMPLGKKSPKEIEGGGTTLVFDTFASVNRDDSLYIGWPEAELEPKDQNVLHMLLGNLSSLGRAESWVHAKITDAPIKLPLGVAADDDPNPIPVFCPDPATVFSDTHYPTFDPKKLAKNAVNPTEFLFDCPRWHLCLDTETIHKERWPTVPGAKWVNYARVSEGAAPRVKRAARPRPDPIVARFMLDGPVLPLVTDTVRVAEAFRAALMGRFRVWCENHPELSDSFRREDGNTYASDIFSGKDARGERRPGHGHAHYFPTSEGDDPRRITHVTVYAPRGFRRGEQSALTRMNSLKRREEDSLRVQLVGLGKPRDFNATVFKRSRVWESVTPFVPHRHLKRRGTQRDTPNLVGPNPIAAFVELTLKELIAHAGQVQPLITSITSGPGSPRPRDFHRARSRKNDDGMLRPFGWFRLVFPEPVDGPLCFGYGCHFGLGLFKAVAGEP